MFKYRITVEKVDDNTSAESAHGPLTFLAENHDDLFRVARLTQAKGIADADKSACCIIGLKLFAEVMLEKRQEALFEPMLAPVKHFIQQLKALPDDGPSSISE